MRQMPNIQAFLYQLIMLQLAVDGVNCGRKAEQNADDGADMSGFKEIIRTLAEIDEDAEEDDEVDSDARENAERTQRFHESR